MEPLWTALIDVASNCLPNSLTQVFFRADAPTDVRDPDFAAHSPYSTR